MDYNNQSLDLTKPDKIGTLAYIMNAPQKKKGPSKARRITADYLHNAALYYLERYAASENRVRRVLTNKISRSCHDHKDQVLSALLPLVDAEIETLRRVGLIDDEKLIDQFYQNYRARGVPFRMSRAKLKQRGFDDFMIEQVMKKNNEDNPQEQELESAIRYLKRRNLWPYLKSSTEDIVSKTKAKQKTWAALSRRGYDSDIIGQAIKIQEID